MGDVVEVPQYMRALERANEVRLERAQVKRDVKAGRVSVVQILEAPPECVLKMTIMDLLLAQPRWGRGRVVKLVRDVPVSENKTIGAMTVRQRKAVGLLVSDPRLRRIPAYRRSEALLAV